MAKGSKKGACSSNTQTAKANCLAHDRREGKKPSYVNPHLSHTNRVVFEDEMIRGRKHIKPIIDRAEKEYTEKTGQKAQKSFAPIRESVLHLRAGITDEQLMNFKADAERLTGWKCIGIYLHQDEGHIRSKYIEGDDNFEINYHAHVLWDCQDHETGKSIKFTRTTLSKMQDLLAKATGMERGNYARETGRKHRSAQEQRKVAEEQRIEQLQQIAKQKQEEQDKKVGIVPQVLSAFKVGPLSKAVVTAREEGRQEAIEEICKGANVSLKPGTKVTSGMIAKDWAKRRSEVDQKEKDLATTKESLKNAQNALKTANNALSKEKEGRRKDKEKAEQEKLKAEQERNALKRKLARLDPTNLERLEKENAKLRSVSILSEELHLDDSNFRQIYRNIRQIVDDAVNSLLHCVRFSTPPDYDDADTINEGVLVAGKQKIIDLCCKSLPDSFLKVDSTLEKAVTMAETPEEDREENITQSRGFHR